MAEAVELKRRLNVMNGVAIVCGLIIGSGIYIAPKGALVGTGSVGLCLILWAVGGVLATFGALTFAELGTTFPSGGEMYYYLEKMYSPFVGFMYLWMYLLLFRPGANAVKCLTFANYILQPFFESDVPNSAVVLIGILLACILTALNCRDVRWSAKGQTFATSVGVLMLFVIAVTGIVYICLGNTENFQDSFAGTSTDIGHIFVSSYSAIFTYWGWNAMNFMVEELKDPYKNLPRVIWISMAVVSCLYISVNVSYIAVLGVDGVLNSQAVAVTFGQKMFGVMSWIVSICVAINTAGSFNSGSLVGSRLCFAGARREHLPDVLALIHVDYLTPCTALIFQLLLVIVLISTVGLYTLFNNVVFVNNVFQCLCVAKMIWLRYRQPDIPRPIKVNIVIPIVFAVSMVILAVVPLATRPRDMAMGCALIFATGVPYYVLFVTWENKPKIYRQWVAKQTIRVQKLMYAVKQETEFKF